MSVETLRRAHLCKIVNLRGHMPRSTLRMNVLPSIYLEMPKMCVETLRTGLVYPRQSIWVVTCLHLLENEHFPIYLLGNPKNVCWNPCFCRKSRGSSGFSQNECFARTMSVDLRWSHAYIYLKNEHVPNLGNPKNVYWNPQNRAQQWFEGSHA